VTIIWALVSGADRGTPAIGAGVFVVGLLDVGDAEPDAVDEPVTALDDGAADGDDAGAVVATVVEGVAGVPPTLAHEASATAAMAARPALTVIGRAVARPCDIPSFCQSG